jgi:carbamoylphosphate synthase large subunit
MDIYPRELVTTSLLADAFAQVPMSTDPAFESRLLALVTEHRVDTYMPFIDEEIATAAALRDGGRFPSGLKALAPSARTSELCLDKHLMAEHLRACGIATPRTALASAPFGAERYFVKPRRGFGSRGAAIVDAEGLSRTVGAAPDDWIVQDICEGPELTIDVFRHPSGSPMRAVCRERLEVKSGVCTKARVSDDPELTELAETLARSLDLHGGFCFQVMRDRGVRYVTDVNARLGAGTALSVAVGVELFAATFAAAWGLDPSPFLPQLTSAHYVTRQYAEFRMT